MKDLPCEISALHSVRRQKANKKGRETQMPLIPLNLGIISRENKNQVGVTNYCEKFR